MLRNIFFESEKKHKDEISHTGLVAAALAFGGVIAEVIRRRAAVDAARTPSLLAGVADSGLDVGREGLRVLLSLEQRRGSPVDGHHLVSHDRAGHGGRERENDGARQHCRSLKRLTTTKDVLQERDDFEDG